MNTNETYTYYRGITLFLILNIIWGIVFSLVVTPIYDKYHAFFWDIELPITVYYIVFTVIGILAAAFVTWWFGGYYETCSSGFLAALLSLLTPLAGIGIFLAIILIIVFAYIALVCAGLILLIAVAVLTEND